MKPPRIPLALPEKCCGRCYWWSALDARKFMGICGQRDHRGETTDKFEGTNCADFEPELKHVGGGCPKFEAEGSAEWME